jgi:hypothetical protein
MAKSKKKKMPSRIKYEQAHPVRSLRIPKVLDDKLREIQEKENVSLLDILKAGAGLFEVKIRAEEEIRKNAYQEGHFKGFTLAQSLYKVTFPCSVCGETMQVNTKEIKEAVREFLIANRWGHSDCIDQ